MKSLLLLMFLLLPTAPQSVGVVTGVVRGADGKPAAGVRVYAMGVRDSLEALNNGTAPLEGLTQTDASGKYRLEVAPGRYYVASGSVNSPTFYPGTAKAADARVVTVASGGLIEAIDFSSFVPPTGPNAIQPLSGTAVLSGVIRFPDGTPAVGIPVVGVSAGSVSGAGLPGNLTATMRAAILSVAAQGVPLPNSIVVRANGGPQLVASTGVSGRYTFPRTPADTYYIAAGYAEAPTLYPGVTELAAAKTIVTTSTTNVNTLDFTVPQPPATTAVRGRVTSVEGAPIGNIRMGIASTTAAAQSPFGLPSLRQNRFVNAGPDGRFEFPDVHTGSYTVTAFFSATRSESKGVAVTDQPLEGVDFQIRASILSGRILAEDGSSLPDVRLFGDAVVSTAGNPNLVLSTILAIAGDGSFGRILEPGDYRFFLRSLPEEYSIKSVTAGGVDLMKETFKFTGLEPVTVDIRVAQRTTALDSPHPSTVSVRGRILDALTGTLTGAERILLCCRESGPTERYSAPLGTDGSFEFAAVPPGRYEVSLRTRSSTAGPTVVNSELIVGTENLSGLDFLSAAQVGQQPANLVFEDGSVAPDGFPARVQFTGTNGRVRVVAQAFRGIQVATLPIGDAYTVSVIDLPEGYVVKSISGLTEPAAARVRPTATGQAPIVITLARESR